MELHWHRKTKVLGENPPLWSRCPPQIPHEESRMIACSSDMSIWLWHSWVWMFLKRPKGPRFTMPKIYDLRIEIFLASLWFWFAYSNDDERQNKNAPTYSSLASFPINKVDENRLMTITCVFWLHVVCQHPWILASEPAAQFPLTSAFA